MGSYDMGWMWSCGTRVVVGKLEWEGAKLVS